jgi:hypothetical protein
MAGGAKTAIAVALDALAAFLPLLEAADRSDVLPSCLVCGAEIPRLIHAGGIGRSADPG